VVLRGTRANQHLIIVEQGQGILSVDEIICGRAAARSRTHAVTDFDRTIPPTISDTCMRQAGSKVSILSHMEWEGQAFQQLRTCMLKIMDASCKQRGHRCQRVSIVWDEATTLQQDVSHLQNASSVLPAARQRRHSAG
jgi:hypothetical protein